MRIELDLSLKDPRRQINLLQIFETISVDTKYSILFFNNEHFLLVKEMENNLHYRIHRDGRIYINTVLNDVSSGKSIINDLYIKIIGFINDICKIEKDSFCDEICVYINGSTASSFYWKNIYEIDRVGDTKINNENIRTFLFDENCLFVKISA